MTDFYKVLNVHRGATLNEIKAAYRKLAKKHHPDMQQASGTEGDNLFKEINIAYQVLSDEQRREEYDRNRNKGFGNVNWTPKSQPFSPHKTPSGPNFKTTYSSGSFKHVPPDPSMYNAPVWNAWHYGDNAIVRNAVHQVEKTDAPMSKQDKYFARLQEKDRREEQERREAMRKQTQDTVHEAAAKLQAQREQRHQSGKASRQQKKKDECTIS